MAPKRRSASKGSKPAARTSTGRKQNTKDSRPSGKEHHSFDRDARLYKTAPSPAAKARGQKLGLWATLAAAWHAYWTGHGMILEQVVVPSTKEPKARKEFRTNFRWWKKFDAKRYVSPLEPRARVGRAFTMFRRWRDRFVAKFRYEPREGLKWFLDLPSSQRRGCVTGKFLKTRLAKPDVLPLVEGCAEIKASRPLLFDDASSTRVEARENRIASSNNEPIRSRRGRDRAFLMYIRFGSCIRISRGSQLMSMA